MKWDEVEREFFIIGVQLGRLSQSFQALASALRRERETDTVSGNETGRSQRVGKIERGAEAEPELPFSPFD